VRLLVVCATAAEIPACASPSRVEVLVTGIGPVEASAVVSRALERNDYGLVINAGIAGAFDGAAQIGEGVVVADDRYEVGLETGAPLALPNGSSVVERAGSDAALVKRLAARGFARVHGVTVSRVTASEATAQRLTALGADIETMEGFAVLRAAEIAATPAIGVRGISNRVGERARSGWDFAAGVAGLEKVLGELLAILEKTDG
jgi:futalosine hydrolase